MAPNGSSASDPPAPSTAARAGSERLDGAAVAALLAAWMGWGFDAFDALLFAYIAKPTLATLHPGAIPAQMAYDLGLLTSLFLIGWATGGILFGRITDRLGRTRTLLLTMLLYSAATAACAAATSVTLLIFFRFIASLGVGGEWAAGAALVSETMPEKWRIWGGAILYTSAPAGLFLAGAIAHLVMGRLYLHDPALGWRICFLAGLLPAAVAFLLRLFVREPERFTKARALGEERGRIAELFTPLLRRRTLTALGLATVALVTWWGCVTFLPRALAEWAAAAGATGAGIGDFVARGNDWFNLGGVAGTLLTVPIALRLGRRPMFALYFAAAMACVLYTFGLPHPPGPRLVLLFFVGVTVFGVFGSFTYYLPELFPTRLRGTGSGFCYNSGRYLASVGPFLTGTLVAKVGGVAPAVFYIGFFYLLGAIILPFAVETRGRPLA